MQELFTLLPCLLGTTFRCLPVQPFRLLPSSNIWRHISLIWPFPHRLQHARWPVDVTELFLQFLLLNADSAVAPLSLASLKILVLQKFDWLIDYRYHHLIPLPRLWLLQLLNLNFTMMLFGMIVSAAHHPAQFRKYTENLNGCGYMVWPVPCVAFCARMFYSPYVYNVKV